jgi:RNA polymerase sigma factor (sigma-70 family)
MHSSACSPIAVPEPLPRLDLTDEQAVDEVIRGNREMFEVIVRRYNTQLYRVGMAYLRNHAQAEDAMQNAYLKAFLHLDRFRGGSAFATWLTRIMINECLMIIRSRKRCVMENIDDENFHPEHESVAFAPAPDPLRGEEIKAVLEEAVQSLPRTHRAVYLLRDVQHLSTAETAQCLGLSKENVKVCLHRAREGLKARLLQSAAAVEIFNYPATYCDPMTARVMQSVLNSSSPSAA